MKRLIVGTLALAISTLAACAVDSTGSDDAYATDSCASATVDSHGYCRATSGRFAYSECCAPADACALATIDDHGICRRVDNGQFAPVACCDALCGGASLDAHGYCRATDGRFALSACCANACIDGQDIQSPACQAAVDSATISQAVDELHEIFFDGRWQSVGVESSEPLEMVRQYLEDLYYGDEEMLEEYQYVENSPSWYWDEPIAGTIQAQVVMDEAVGQLEWLYEWSHEPEEIAQIQDQATRAIQSLISAGAVFGFDGYEQNYCAAPTSMLLVLDTAESHVYGVDLSPCTE
ncbi:MAG: hypothetical protein JRI23_32090 [Deltaproteobacteria bacterium]|jgi:hypothetical protein|nr:hypothetical protein [Deltaproteobacteria bacterium]MBW2536874.1 hypothetical protein [Deltaproteobacteria bacterium]